MTAFDVEMGEERGLVLATIRCTVCGELRRVALDDNAMQTIMISVGAGALAEILTKPKGIRRVLFSTALGTLANEVPDVVLAGLWLLTHASSHTEQQRRDASKGKDSVH